MKNVVPLLFILLLSSLTSENIRAQDKTIILLRHAEKDVSATANKADPKLTAEGQKRAERLVEKIEKYQPQQIFSTAFIRTRATVAPLAENLNPNYRIQTQFYDFNELEEFAKRLMNLDAKTVVVVGHNTTTPALANLLIKQNKYKDLADDEYNKIFIIKIHGKKIEDKVIEY